MLVKETPGIYGNYYNIAYALVRQETRHLIWQADVSKSDTLDDDVIKWKHFPRYWPFVREFTGHWRIPLTKASDAEIWCFLWSAIE